MALNQDLFASIFSEMDEGPEVPTILLGDFNCLPMHVPAVQERLERGSLVDVCSMPSLTGQSEPLHTCVAHNSNTATRRACACPPFYGRCAQTGRY